MMSLHKKWTSLLAFHGVYDKLIRQRNLQCDVIAQEINILMYISLKVTLMFHNFVYCFVIAPFTVMKLIPCYKIHMSAYNMCICLLPIINCSLWWLFLCMYRNKVMILINYSWSACGRKLLINLSFLLKAS